MPTHPCAVIGFCLVTVLAACGGGEPPPAAPSSPPGDSEGGAFAMPSPVQSEAQLHEGGTELIVEASTMDMQEAGAMAMDHGAVDAGTDAMGHAHAAMADGGAHHKAKAGSGKSPSDGGAPKKK